MFITSTVEHNDIMMLYDWLPYTKRLVDVNKNGVIDICQLAKYIQECIDNGDNENKLYYLHRVPRVHLSDTQCNDFLIENKI